MSNKSLKIFAGLALMFGACVLLLSFSQADSPEGSFIKQLADTSQTVRDNAAKQLRIIVDEHRTTLGEGHIRAHDSAYWYDKISKVNMRREVNDVVKSLGLQSAEREMGMCFGQGCYDTYRLDNSMVLQLYYNSNKPNTVYFDTIILDLKSVWIVAPKNFTGTWITYYVNGQRANCIQYKRGIYHGEFISYHDNGRVSVKQHYDALGANGSDSGFYYSGKLRYHGNYRNGKQDGEWIQYYESGPVRNTRTYVNGEDDGVERDYYENGVLYTESVYDHGKQVRHRAWDRNGVLTFDTQKN